MQLPNDLLSCLVDHLKAEGAYVLASPEDAAFFRSLGKPALAPAPTPPLPAKPIVAPLPPKKEKVPLPPPAPKKEPKAEEAPPAPLPKIATDFTRVRTLLGVVAPELPILSEIPSDQIAGRIAERWKTKNQTAPISILSFQEPPEQREFLEQIARALDAYFGPAKIISAETIEKEKQWEAFLSVKDLKWVIACDYTLWQLTELMKHYKETPAQGTRELSGIPLFLLPDLSLYLKDPSLKRSLWKALCQKYS